MRWNLPDYPSALTVKSSRTQRLSALLSRTLFRWQFCPLTDDPVDHAREIATRLTCCERLDNRHRRLIRVVIDSRIARSSIALSKALPLITPVLPVSVILRRHDWPSRPPCHQRPLSLPRGTLDGSSALLIPWRACCTKRSRRFSSTGPELD